MVRPVSDLSEERHFQTILTACTTMRMKGLPTYPEDDQNGYISYNSPYKQWVYNSDIEGAVIPTGVYVDTGDGVYNFCGRGQSGLMIDFDNGRVLFEGRHFGENYDKLNVEAEFSQLRI